MACASTATPTPVTQPAIAGYLGCGDSFDDALGTFALRYADQTVIDHAALTDALLDGRVIAVDESG